MYSYLWTYCRVHVWAASGMPHTVPLKTLNRALRGLNKASVEPQ
jgi:hypothetical protein